MKINILPLLRGEKDNITFCFTDDMRGFSADITEGSYKAEGKVKNFSGYMLLEGEIKAEFFATCGRCSKGTKQILKARVSRPVAQTLTQEDDDYIIALENGELDIREAVEEAVFMEIPVRFLCKEDCKGLCPKCGADLNNTS
ncbi:MAG: DUF177 domain-containing protein, partial [Clostridia bacterium]|nr:DUF177 domain-containing protein [Clostridia bacterium]